MAKLIEQIEALKDDLKGLVKEARDADLDGANIKRIAIWNVRQQIEAKNEALRRLRETALEISQDIHDQLFLPLEEESFVEGDGAGEGDGAPRH
jgi:hypothetical protein